MTATALKQGFALLVTFSEAIRAAGEIPSGTLYAAAMMQGMELEAYNKAIETLINTGLVKRTPAHLLVWTGPKETP